MHHITLIAPVLFLFSWRALAMCPVPPANVPSEDAKKIAVMKLGQFLACSEDDPINDQSPCNTFASRGLEAIYGVSDFKTGNNTFLSANQIYDKVNSGGKWKKIGGVLNSDNALCAQAASNAALPVIAVMKASVHGHIALVIPGEPKAAPTWGGTLAPNSASFFYNKPKDSYVSGPLSKAFGSVNAASSTYYYRVMP